MTYNWWYGDQLNDAGTIAFIQRDLSKREGNVYHTEKRAKVEKEQTMIGGARSPEVGAEADEEKRADLVDGRSSCCTRARASA